MLSLRSSVEANLTRLPGQLYQHTNDNEISNVFTYKIVNKTNEEVSDISFRLLNARGEIKEVTGKRFSIPANLLVEGTLFIEMKISDLESEKTELKVGVFSGDKQIETTETIFMGPRSFR